MAAMKVPEISAPKDSVEIYNPGTGDFAGFRIVIAPSGKAWAIDGAGRGQGQLGPGLTDRFFNDLAAASPLAQLPNQRCAANPAADLTAVTAKSATIIIWNGQRSADISCSADPRAAALLYDASTVQRALYVQAYRVRSGVMFGLAGGAIVTGGAKAPPPPPTDGMGTGY